MGVTTRAQAKQDAINLRLKLMTQLHGVQAIAGHFDEYYKSAIKNGAHKLSHQALKSCTEQLSKIANTVSFETLGRVSTDDTVSTIRVQISALNMQCEGVVDALADLKKKLESDESDESFDLAHPFYAFIYHVHASQLDALLPGGIDWAFELQEEDEHILTHAEQEELEAALTDSDSVMATQDIESDWEPDWDSFSETGERFHTPMPEYDIYSLYDDYNEGDTYENADVYQVDVKSLQDIMQNRYSMGAAIDSIMQIVSKAAEQDGLAILQVKLSENDLAGILTDLADFEKYPQYNFLAADPMVCTLVEHFSLDNMSNAALMQAYNRYDHYMADPIAAFKALNKTLMDHYNDIVQRDHFNENSQYGENNVALYLDDLSLLERIEVVKGDGIELGLGLSYTLGLIEQGAEELNVATRISVNKHLENGEYNELFELIASVPRSEGVTSDPLYQVLTEQFGFYRFSNEELTTALNVLSTHERNADIAIQQDALSEKSYALVSNKGEAAKDHKALIAHALENRQSLLPVKKAPHVSYKMLMQGTEKVKAQMRQNGAEGRKSLLPEKAPKHIPTKVRMRSTNSVKARMERNAAGKRVSLLPAKAPKHVAPKIPMRSAERIKAQMDKNGAEARVSLLPAKAPKQAQVKVHMQGTKAFKAEITRAVNKRPTSELAKEARAALAKTFIPKVIGLVGLYEKQPEVSGYAFIKGYMPAFLGGDKQAQGAQVPAHRMAQMQPIIDVALSLKGQLGDNEGNYHVGEKKPVAIIQGAALELTDKIEAARRPESSKLYVVLMNQLGLKGLSAEGKTEAKDAYAAYQQEQSVVHAVVANA